MNAELLTVWKSKSGMKKIAIAWLAALLLLCLASCDDKAQKDGAFSSRPIEEESTGTEMPGDPNTDTEPGSDAVWTPFF